MKHTRHNAVSVLIIAILLAAVSTAWAIENPADGGGNLKAFPASSPLVIPAAAFSTKGNDASSHQMAWWDGYLRGTSSPGGCVQAPVYLPRFARIYQFWISYVDDDGSQNFSVWLSRTSNFEPGEMEDLATVTTSGSSPSVQTAGDFSILYPIVAHPDYSYHVSVCLPSADTKLISARVWYLEDVLFADGFDSAGTSSWSEVLQ